MTDELRKSFHESLDDVRDQIVQMSAMTAESISMVTEVLLDLDFERAQQIVDDDDNIDAISVAVEEQCYSMLALQQPMATDLRSILTTLWINSEVERSADLVSNIAKGARRMYGTKFSPRLRTIIVQMSVEAARLCRLATDAYVDKNAGLAAALDDIDDRLDELQHECVVAIFEAHADGDFDLQSAIQMALITRYYERIGDHAVNIGERVRYMVDGWMPERVAAERVRLRQTTADDGNDAGPVVDGADSGDTSE
jgi:phosphate transport system protein